MENLRIKIERLVRQALGPLVRQLLHYKVSPNSVSIAGFLVTIVAVGLFLSGQFVAAGVIFVVGSLFDVADGELARAGNRATPFGALFDSLLDRTSEGALLIAITYYFADQGEIFGVMVTSGGMLGAVATSYVRARAEVLGVACTVGWMTRPERIVILSLGLTFDLLLVAVVVLFLLTTLTVIQRTVHVHRILRKGELYTVNGIGSKR